MSEIQLCSYKFQGVCRIIPEQRADGSPIEYLPQTKYNNVRNLPLNEYGSALFCKFKIPNGINEEGVYALLVSSKLKYIGKCERLSPRWNTGYGNISPRNCFVHGQSTNCRLNNLILNAYKANSAIDLYFYKTNNSSEIEAYLIQRLDPEWNIQKAAQPSKTKKLTERIMRNSRNKYQPLTDYLLQSKKTTECLTYDRIEEILGFKLPNSSYRYRPWWANSGQSHSISWIKAGWQVDLVKLGKSITFKKKHLDSSHILR